MLGGITAVRVELRIFREEVRKNIKILLCYPIEIVFWSIFPLLWVLPFLFQGQALVGGWQSASFARLTGTTQYIPYVLIGAIVSTYVFSALYGMGGSLRMESYWGTLELILGSPAHRITVLLGKAVSESIMGSSFALVQTLLCVLVFGVRLTVGQVFPILLVMLLLIAGLYGLAIALAGITLQIKESRTLAHTIEWLMYLFSPVRYPVEINPVIKLVSLAIPLTYALIVIRGISLLGKSVATLWRNVAVLAGLDLLMIGVGLVTFYAVEKKVRRSGTIGHY
jgi:ABC-2 type transport system permease protein